MKGLILVLTVTCLTVSCLSYLILFEGNASSLKAWWQDLARDSEVLPFAPYKSRVVDKSEIKTKGSNEFVVFDQHLFWKGSGAKLVPHLNQKNVVQNVIILDGGSGYSDIVSVHVTGAGGELFEFEPVTTYQGAISSVKLKKTSLWNEEPLVYAKDETQPLSGLVVSKFPGGQIIEQIPYLGGKIHGTIKSWNENGIPIHSKEYVRGKKHGTHIYWFARADDPEDYKPIKSENGDIYPTLWVKLLEDAKKKFKGKFGTHEANEWITFNYRRQGGEFPVRLLEHWKQNLRHGLFEGFDSIGNKTFKDDYKMGLRVKHKIFDKTKK